jgi:hypothetical protein
MQKLIVVMASQARAWVRRYEKCNTNCERAALILAAPDVLHSKRNAYGKEVTRIVT